MPIAPTSPVVFPVVAPHNDKNKLPPGGQVLVRHTHVFPDLLNEKAYGDWRDDLKRDGFVVVKSAIPSGRAFQYIDDIQDWFQSFGLGYDKNNRATVRQETLPIIQPNGIIRAYGAPHESFTWNIRCEPGVIEPFEKLYGTKDLLVSFTGINYTFANRNDIPVNNAWPHQDQDPEGPGLRCVQGILNLNENDGDDGGLIVLKGGHLTSEKFHEEFRRRGEDRGFRWTNEYYQYTNEGLAWLREHNDGEWVKVNAGPGDLVLWDSRLPHYNSSPTGTRDRCAVYVCYYPTEYATIEELKLKKELFYKQKGTTHWPMALQPFQEELNTPMRDGEPCPHNQWKPRQAPQLSRRGFELTGIPYLEALKAKSA